VEHEECRWVEKVASHCEVEDGRNREVYGPTRVSTPDALVEHDEATQLQAAGEGVNGKAPEQELGSPTDGVGGCVSLRKLGRMTKAVLLTSSEVKAF
jgi:hypothetical protein